MEESPSVNQEYHSPFSAENQQEQRLEYIKQNSDDQNEALRSSHRRKYSRLSSSSSLSSSPSKNRKRSHSHTKKHRSRERERQTQDSSATTAASTRNGPRFQTFPKPPNFNEAQGDWRCQDCGNWNFAKRTHCNSCKIEKPSKTTNSRERSSRYYNDRDDKNYSSSNRITNRDSQYDRYSDKTSDNDRRQQYTRSNGGSSRSYNDRDRSYERRNSRERSRSNDRQNSSRSIRDDRNTHRGFSSQQEGSLRNNGDSNSNNITHEGGRQYLHSSRFSNQPPSQSADEYKGKSHDSSYNTNGNNTQQWQTSTGGYDQDRREDKGLRDTNHRYQRDDRDNRRDDFSRSDRREERYNDDNRYSRDDKGGRDNKYDTNSRYRDRDDYNNNSSRDNNNRYSSDLPVRKQFQKKEGDWECVHCKNINYARRNECNRCRKPKE